MYFKKESYTNDMEILVTNANLVTFSGTVLSAGALADEHGKKYVKAGTLISATGAVITQTGSAGSETLSATPVGILYDTVDVTYGDMPASLVVEGYIRLDRVLAPFATAAQNLIKTALPNVKFR